MPGVVRADVDTAGGTIRASGNSTVYVNNKLVIVDGDPVDPHGPGEHAGATMVASGSSNTFINNKKVCFAGDLATCGDAATGSGNAFFGGIS
jgi:uncharacterized Zn-binding protein involved in type VI secretion